MNKSLETMYMYLSRLSPLPQEQWNSFASLAKPITIRKHHYFLQAGEYPNTIAQCINGLFRLYYLTSDGNELNKSFCVTGEFLASYSSLLQRTPAFFSIQALIDSEVMVFSYSDIQFLYTQHPCWERLGRIIVENLYMKKECRERELLMLSTEERYRIFLEQYGHLTKHIPQYHIASYLGITPVALSRIRRKLT